MRKTRHAELRMAQRAVRDHQLDILMQCATPSPAPGGAVRLTLTKKAVQDFITEQKRLIQAASRLSGLTAIVKDNAIVTVYKCN